MKFLSKPLIVLAAVSAALIGPPAHADVLASYEFTSSSAAATSKDPNVTAGSFSFAQGTNTNRGFSSAGNMFARVSVTGATDLAGAISGNEYVTVTITPIPGFPLNLTSLTVDLGYSLNGTSVPAGVGVELGTSVFSSIGGFTADQVLATQTFTAADQGSNNLYQNVNIDLSGEAYQGLTTPIEFRIYYYDSITGTTPTQPIHRIDNFTLNGSLPSDTAPPEIVLPTIPADDATGVLVASSVTATFSEPIALQDGGTITIDDLGVGPDTVITLPDARVSVASGTNLVITPASPLATSTSYAIQISNNAVKDLAPTPNFFAGISDTTTWNFQTAADGTAPSLVLPTTPADGSTGVATTTNFVAEFDENIVAGSGNIRIKNLSTSSTMVIPVGAPQVSISGNTLTIDPTTDLGWADDYAIQIDAGAIKDVTGNAFGGILDDTTWNFTVAGTKVLAASDDRVDTQFTSPPDSLLDNTRVTDMAVGPVSSTRYFRSYLTFDLSGASAASGETTLVLSSAPSGSASTANEGNTSSVAQTFTLFVLDSDWNGAPFPGPEGTAVATINFTPASGNDNRGISFTSAALTTAFNNAVAVGGNLHLGIKSDAEGTDARSFLFLGSMEDVGLEPRLNYTVASGGNTFANWITGKPGVGSQTAVGDDPDGDGNGNGVENFFGTEPGVFSAGVVAGTLNPGTGTFTFTHPQGSLASDLTATYRWSTDLVNFHDDGASIGGTTVSFSTLPNPVVPGTPTTVTATVSGTPVQKLFVRVEVTQN
jgi:hypothetical protein